jgi:UDP-GlcNAc:undecaprenyl-phosphate GlcNAc-1-phosphate transferase
MTTILVIFFISLIISLVLTPLIGKLGVRLGAIDNPGERKVHTEPIPRSGGLAIFISFIVTACVVSRLGTNISDLISIDRRMVFLLAGAIVTFGIGLFDDFHRLGPKIKFVFQVIGASLAFYGGMSITTASFFGFLLKYKAISYIITVLWFLLFINAVNLVDGLDGLAGGIIVFASMVIVILSILSENYLSALYFAILCGSVLGFLRYNFNPASIFLGDGGSYFLGYAIAGLSILGSVKSQTGAAMVIPLLALGVPLFDTIFSPIRRFVRGREMFHPDSGHIHHKLINLGLTTRKVVLIIYGITLSLCIIAVIVINLRDERAGLFLIILGIAAVIFIRKIGYLEYLASDKFYGWFRDISDQTGMRHERRSFLNHQIELSRSADINALWEKLVEIAGFLELDFIEMKLTDQAARSDQPKLPAFEFSNGGMDPAMMDWNRMMHINLPLSNKDCEFGTLTIARDLVQSPLTPFTLRRVEQLRRTIIDTLVKLNPSADYPKE